VARKVATTTGNSLDRLENVDLRWQPEPLWDEWPAGPDNEFVIWRVEQAFRDEAIAGAPGRMLDAACGNAFHAPAFVAAGWRVVGLEPSLEMIERAREFAAAHGTGLPLLRGIGETLPFAAATFDRVVCQSSLDHYADPAKGMREFARVLKPGGALVIGLVNYHGLSCRASRLVYRAGRRLGRIPRASRRFWDDPTVGEHTFEGSVAALRRFAPPELRLEKRTGVSMLWAFPGWGRLLRTGGERGMAVTLRNRALHGLDRIARRLPERADFVITTWRRA
jgi:SAM-dependent methyltransferase